MTDADIDSFAASQPAVSDRNPAVDGTASSPGIGGMWALFFGLALLMIGNGLNGALIGVRSGIEGFSVVVSGVVMAGYFAGFLLAPSIVLRMLSRVGHIRVFAGLASTASTAVLIHAVSVVPVTWVMMRFVFGFCFAGLYIVIESWLGEMSDVSNRGRTLAIYMIVSMGGLGIGQYMIALADPNSFRLFILSSVLVSMALVPVTLVETKRVPEIRLPEAVPIRELLRLVPTGVTGSFMSGGAAGVLLGLSAVYAHDVGLSISRTALFLIAPTIGGVVMQWPVGKLSDRLSRRIVIFGVASVAAVLCAVAIVVPADNPLVLLIMFGIGGTMYPLYSLVVSYTMDWVPVEKTVGAAGSLIRVNGSGALAGPLVAAPLMSWIGPVLFYWVMGAYFSVIVGFISYRILFREAIPKEEERPYVPFPARATTIAFRLVTGPGKVTKRVSRRVSTHRHEHRGADERFEQVVDEAGVASRQVPDVN